MAKIISKKTIDKLFHFAVLIKSLFGFFEILAGIFVAIAGEKLIDNFLIDLAMGEIARDPSDFIARHFVAWSVSVYLGSKFFAVFYLLFHGMVNISLVIALMKGKIGFYPWAIAGFGVFIIYQIYKFLHTFSPSLLLLTIFDLLVVLLIWIEYERQQKRKNAQIIL